MNKVYAITGGATGIGFSVKEKLIASGDRVIVIDIKDADIIADLTTLQGRQKAIEGIQKLASDGLDGFIPCAGLGPHVKPCAKITQLNYFAVIKLTQALLPLLIARQGAVVIISSNSASLPGLNQDYVNFLAQENEDKACEIINTLDGHNAYAGSKFAVAQWMRKQSTSYMRQGVRMNAVAPGITQTPLTTGVFNDEEFGEGIKQFNEMTPFGKMASPNMIADTIIFLLSKEAQFVCGSVLFVDGGTDAMLRPDQF